MVLLTNMQKTNQNLIKIAELLSDGHYHGGTCVGAHLNISRAAVWKALKKLEQYGISLESTKGKGYLLKSPLILLSKEKIQSLLNLLEKDSELRNQKRAEIDPVVKKALQIEIFEKIDSTNDYLKENLKNSNSKKIRVCLAETQSQGKGRLGRSWYSPFGQNIYLSTLYPFEKDVSELTGLSLVVALSICDAICLMLPSYRKDLFVKWPNDVYINDSKLAGTLIEIQAESNGFCRAIIGIGINVNMTKASKSDINQNWSSLKQVTREYLDRNKLCAHLIMCLMNYLRRFSCDGLSCFLDEWKERDVLLGRMVALSSGGREHKGMCVGINAQGHLLLESSDGPVRAYSSGDTTLLK